MNKDISHSGWLILSISLVVFVLGNILYISMPKKKKEFRGYNQDKIRSILFKFSQVTFILSLLGFISYLIVIQQKVGLLNTISDPNLLNLAISEDTISINMISLIFFKLSFPNSGILLLQYLEFGKSKKILFYWIISVLVNISVKRNVLFYIVIYNLVIYLFNNANKKKSILKIKELVLLSISSFGSIYIFQFLQKKLNKESLLFKPEIFFIPISTSFATSLLYYIGNPISFSIYMSDISDYSKQVPFLGITFRFVYKIIYGLFGKTYDDSFLALKFVNTPYPFNTTFSQYYIYLEGGILWLIVFYFLLGFFSIRSYLLFIQRKDYISLVNLSFILVFMIFSIREYLPILLDFWVFLFYLFSLTTIIKRKCRI
ncbi:O-antigen polymerase [Enterococcus sp. 1001283B150225_161107_E12]|uniref:O-antigen polymerase n=1 Tax=Enterococcus sp. 1001283B150225_161107_E12 TaxID=2787145 RepID=UPI0018A1100B|nr:O-antigen polymerase [Enterococcus sp. 1001283B150225_161107_E12]